MFQLFGRFVLHRIRRHRLDALADLALLFSYLLRCFYEVLSLLFEIVEVQAAPLILIVSLLLLSKSIMLNFSRRFVFPRFVAGATDRLSAVMNLFSQDSSIANGLGIREPAKR
jgi:hypothetical protein